MKSLFTNLEQSKWMKKFFERHASIRKPSEHRWWHWNNDNNTEPVFHERKSEGIYRGNQIIYGLMNYNWDKSCPEGTLFNFEDQQRYIENTYPAYTLDQLEELLPGSINDNGRMYEREIYHPYGDSITKAWRYSYSTHSNSVTLTIKTKPINLSNDSFQNIIELLNVLEEKGVFK